MRWTFETLKSLIRNPEETLSGLEETFYGSHSLMVENRGRQKSILELMLKESVDSLTPEELHEVKNGLIDLADKYQVNPNIKRKLEGIPSFEDVMQECKAYIFKCDDPSAVKDISLVGKTTELCKKLSIYIPELRLKDKNRVQAVIVRFYEIIEKFDFGGYDASAYREPIWKLEQSL